MCVGGGSGLSATEVDEVGGSLEAAAVGALAPAALELLEPEPLPHPLRTTAMASDVTHPRAGMATPLRPMPTSQIVRTSPEPLGS